MGGENLLQKEAKPPSALAFYIRCLKTSLSWPWAVAGLASGITGIVLPAVAKSFPDYGVVLNDLV